MTSPGLSQVSFGPGRTTSPSGMPPHLDASADPANPIAPNDTPTAIAKAVFLEVMLIPFHHARNPPLHAHTTVVLRTGQSTLDSCEAHPTARLNPCTDSARSRVRRFSRPAPRRECHRSHCPGCRPHGCRPARLAPVRTAPASTAVLRSASLRSVRLRSLWSTRHWQVGSGQPR